MKKFNHVFLMCIFFVLFYTGCQKSPKRENYESELSFMLSDCNYRNSNNPLACVELAKRYNERDKNKEQREVLTFCKNKDNYPDGMG